MADLSKIPIRYYDPDEIYHYKIDNRPLEDLAAQIEALNADIERVLADLEASKGETLDLQHFLAVSHNQDGSLKPDAVNNIDSSSHNSVKTNIEDHEDSANYVRMSVTERAKLSTIDENATYLKIVVGSEKLTGDIIFEDSSTIQVSNSGNVVSLATKFSPDSLHVHYYSQIPVGAINGSNTIFTTPAATAYMPGTLRVYKNGIRQTSNINELDPANGVFEFTTVAPITGDTIRIDFDVSV